MLFCKHVCEVKIWLSIKIKIKEYFDKGHPGMWCVSCGELSLDFIGTTNLLNADELYSPPIYPEILDHTSKILFI
jgi:hypothetical protein